MADLSQPCALGTAAVFEDFRLGMHFTGPVRAVTQEDLDAFASVSGDKHPLHTDPGYAHSQGFQRPLIHGPFGLAGFFGWLYGRGIGRDAIVALLDTRWRYLAPIYVGDQLRYEMTITRCQRTSGGSRGVVGRHVRVLNQDGVEVQEGSTNVLLRASGTSSDVSQELMTGAWAKRLADRLNGDERFRSATATWDGTIGLAGDSEETQLRVYRGKVLEAGVRTPAGPTFTVAASDLAWAQLVSAESNDFMRRAMRGTFSVKGAAYEYLRLTKAIEIVIDAMRAEFHEGAQR